MTAVVEVLNASVRRGSTWILDHVTWQVDDDQRWVIIGPNGAGKTTLVDLVSARQHPTTGQVRLCGDQMGRVDVFELRPRIGVSSTSLETQIPLDETVQNVVMSAAYAIFGRWREAYQPQDFARAQALMVQLRIDPLAERLFGTLSDGERQRVQIARALMTDPELLVLDEPTSGLDLAGRELLLGTLSRLVRNPRSPAVVLVTHHVEEIPAGMTHGLFLKQGKVVAAGPLAEVMNDIVLSRTFDLPLSVSQADGRWRAQATQRLWG